jgi:hypothetical protein
MKQIAHIIKKHLPDWHVTLRQMYFHEMEQAWVIRIDVSSSGHHAYAEKSITQEPVVADWSQLIEQLPDNLKILEGKYYTRYAPDSDFIVACNRASDELKGYNEQD